MSRDIYAKIVISRQSSQCTTNKHWYMYVNCDNICTYDD